MAVNDQQIQDRLRQLGSSGQAPELPVARIVAAGRVRHRRRLVGSVGAVLVLLASPYAVWAARQASVGDAPVTAAAVTSRTTSTAAATVSRAVTSPAPRPPLGAPGCPPGPPNLVQRPSVDAPVLSRPVQAAAGRHRDVLRRPAPAQRERSADPFGAAHRRASTRSMDGRKTVGRCQAQRAGRSQEPREPDRSLADRHLTWRPGDHHSVDTGENSTRELPGLHGHDLAGTIRVRTSEREPPHSARNVLGDKPPPSA